MKSYVLFRSDAPEDWRQISAISAKEAAEQGKIVFPDIKPGVKIMAREGKDIFRLCPLADAETSEIVF